MPPKTPSVGAEDGPGHHNAAEQPRESEHHDIFFVRQQWRAAEVAQDPHVLDHFQVDKAPTRGGQPNPDEGKFIEGEGRRKEPVRFDEEGHRKVMSIAFPQGEQGAPASAGPVLCALPLHPDPGASSATTCYLLNVANLRYVTAWTAEEWNQSPRARPRPPEEDDLGPDRFSLLVATAAGNVYLVEKVSSGWDAADPLRNVRFSRVDLDREPGLWAELRNGVVVGRAALGEGARRAVVPLVNIESLA